MLDLPGFGLCLWAVFYPHPQAVVIAALAIAPPVAVTVAFLSRGAISLNNRRGQSRRTIGWLLLFPAIALGTRAAIDHTLVDYQGALISAGLLGCFFAAAAVSSEHEFRTFAWVSGMVVLGAVWGWGGVVEANALLERSAVQIARTTVTGKRHHAGYRSEAYELEIAPTPWVEPGSLLAVNQAAYEKARVGSVVCLGLHTGSLGWRWYQSVAC